MIALGLLVVCLAVVFGGRRLGAAIRSAMQRTIRGTIRGPLRVWRPTAGLTSVALLSLALVLLVRGAAPEALVCLAIGAGLAVGARRRATPASPEASPGVHGDVMSRQEACAILGLAPDPAPQAVQAAYRRLIQRAHPDHGGTVGLAAQLNRARAALTGR